MSEIMVDVELLRESASAVPGNAHDFLAWVRAVVENIPEDFRASASVEISAYVEYDCAYADFVLTYRRPETDEEREQRERKVRARWEQSREEELRALAYLQAKYGAG